MDKQGTPVIDPTKNVLDLVSAETKRQDDLRTMESAHFREMMIRDREYAAELRSIERMRLDAIRAVDVANAQRTVDVQATLAQTLQQQVASTAEAMRTTQAAIQQSNTEALSAVIKPLVDRIGLIEQQQYLQAGAKGQVVESRDTRADQRLNVNTVIILIGLAIAMATFFLSK